MANNKSSGGGDSGGRRATTTTQIPVSAVYAAASSVNAEITVFVLLTGILVGLVLVLVVLCICKCFLKPSKPQLKRQQVVFTKYSSERDVVEASDRYEEVTVESVPSGRSPSPSVLHLRASADDDHHRLSSQDVALGQREGVDNRPLLEVTTFFSTSDSRVFPQCSRETSHQEGGGGGGGSSSSDGDHNGHFPLVARNSEEELGDPSRCFPRSPPIQRQPSVCLQMSDEHLDRYAGVRDCAVALASPEGSSSPEGTPTESSSRVEVTRVSAEVHQAPRLDAESTQPHHNHHHHHLSLSASPAMLFPRCSPKFSPLSSRSLDDQEQSRRRPGSTQSSPVAGSHTVLLRPVSAYDVREEKATEIHHATSTEDGVLESMMELRCRENSRRLLVRRKGSLLSDDDEGGEPRSKVRYNDTGSREEVNEEVLDVFAADATNLITPEVAEEFAEMQNRSAEEERLEAAMALQSKQLWELRATFEEDEQMSDTLRLEEMDSVDDGEEQHCDAKDKGDCPVSGSNTTECNRLALPSYESRRQSYKNILSKRVKKLDSSLETSTSVDNSFDSVETEGSSTDASRLEAITTSMESTTDNTDSTGEGQIHRLQQMKHDSGYKSLEANGSKTVRKQIHFAVEDEGGAEPVVEKKTGEEGSSVTVTMTTFAVPVTLGLPSVSARRSGRITRGIEEGGGGKTASKKRRDYTRERQVVETSFGTTGEMESDAASGQESLDDGQGKTSVFLRFFRANREQQSQEKQPRRSLRPFTRDFSIDEKSDALFHEFSRREPVLEFGSRCRSPRLHTRHRLYHRHPDGDGSTGSPGHTRTKLSPQDSIEEEQRSTDAEVGVAERHCTNDIPVIKVAGEDSS